MNRRSLSYNWTEEERITCARWRRGMAVFYGCAALIVFGLVLLSRLSGLAPNEASDREAWSAGFAGRASNRRAVCTRKVDQTCASSSTVE
jgi:hypothetical protein